MKKIIVLFILTFSIGSAVHGQSIRTFSNFELSPAFSDNLYQYSVFYGETVQKQAKIPFKFSTGLRYSLNNLKKGTYLGNGASTINELTFNQSIWYSTLGLPVGLTFFYKNIGLGGFQELASLSLKKKFSEEKTPLAEKETLQTAGFTSIFGKKQNLSSGLFVSYNFYDTFTLRLGVNHVNSTFTKLSNTNKEIGFTRLGDNLYSIALRLNFEK